MVSKQKFKYLLGIIILSLSMIVLFNPSLVFAENTENAENQEDSNIINDYKKNTTLNDFFTEIYESENSCLEVYNSSGIDVTEDWESLLVELYSTNKINEIINLVETQNLQLCSTIISIEPLGSVQQQTVTKTFYQSGTALNEFKYWYMRLTGTITYSTVSRKILSATSPSVSIESLVFSEPWRMWITDVSSGYTINSNNVYFWGKYTMVGSYGYPMIGGIHSFGTNTISLTGYPAF